MKSPKDFKYKTPVREEAGEQVQAPGGGLNQPSRRSPRRRGRGIPQSPAPEVQSRRLGAQPGRPGPTAHAQLIGPLIPPDRSARTARPPGQEDPVTRAPHSFQEKEAKSAASASHRRSSRDELLEDSREVEELQGTHHAEGEPEGADPVALSIGSKKDAPRRKAQEKEGPKRYQTRSNRKTQENKSCSSGHSPAGIPRRTYAPAPHPHVPQSGPRSPERRRLRRGYEHPW